MECKSNDWKTTAVESSKPKAVAENQSQINSTYCGKTRFFSGAIAVEAKKSQHRSGPDSKQSMDKGRGFWSRAGVSG